MIPAAQGDIRGDGSTFALPLYGQWESEHPESHVRYSSFPAGSQKGIDLFCSGKTDFAASDWPLSPARAAGNVLQIPVAVGAIVPIYNVAGIRSNLHFSRETLARIFGPGDNKTPRIEWWDDPLIRRDQQAGNLDEIETDDQPQVSLPHKKIKIVYRSDGSGSTFIFLQFLHGSRDWTGSEPWFNTPDWPSPKTSAAGSTELAANVQRLGSDGSIGYVEYYYVLAPDRFGLERRPDFGCILDPAGRKCINATIQSIGAAICPDMPRAIGSSPAVNLPEMQRCTVDSLNQDAYRISAFTFLLVPVHVANEERRRTLQNFLRWMLTTGQSVASGVGYAPLPPTLAKLELEAINQIQP
jgi:phosphate transport system substrate-binding protein